MDGHQIPQQMVIEVGETFKRILKEVETFLLCSGLKQIFLFFFSKPYLIFPAGSVLFHNCVILCGILQSIWFSVFPF